MKKKTIDELDRIAELLAIDRTTIIRKIISTRIKQQKIEVALDLYQKGDTLERTANLSDASLWDLCEELKNRGITSKFDIENEKNLLLKIEAIIKN